MPNAFLSTLSLRRATSGAVPPGMMAGIFYPRSPCGERLPIMRKYCPTTKFSIHALLAESDPRRVGRQCTRRFFYPRSPCGERRCISRSTPVQAAFLSTLSLRRATLSSCSSLFTAFLFSIHALLAESDRYTNGEECIELLFLSTLSLRRATNSRADNLKRHKIFYPRSPCGERLRKCQIIPIIQVFYPRSPCGERPAFC